MLVNGKNQVKDGQESNTDQEPKVFITLNDPDRGKVVGHSKAVRIRQMRIVKYWNHIIALHNGENNE